MGSTISELLKTMNTSKKLIIFCYLIFTPAVFSKALPEPQNFDNLLQERTIDIPDNVLEVAAVGFLAGLAGQLLLLLRGNESKDSRLNKDFLNVFFKRKNSINL